MAMDTDEKLCQQHHRWFLQLQSGEETTLNPRANQTLCVTHVFLVDPESAGQGVVAACVEMGTRNIMLAQLSSGKTDAELQTPVVLDEEFCFYVMRPGGDTDADADTHVGADAAGVRFEGFVLPLPSPDKDEEIEEEEAASSEDDDDRIDEDYEEDSETDGEVQVDVDSARATGAKDVGKVAARAFLGLFLFSYMVGFFGLLI